MERIRSDFVLNQMLKIQIKRFGAKTELHFAELMIIVSRSPFDWKDHGSCDLIKINNEQDN